MYKDNIDKMVDYEKLMQRFDKEGKILELELYDKSIESNDAYNKGYYQGFSKAIHMLDRMYRE